MTKVLDKVEENKKRIGAKTLADLSSRPLSKVLRRETWGDHERAEYSPFEQALVRATISREGYADLMAQTWFIYCALEDKTDELRGHPVASRVIFDALRRRSSIERDLEFYFGTDWRSQIKPLPLTEEYCARIRAADGVQFVAHHYTRYLADLSGGLMIAAALRKAWNLDGGGLTLYDFAELGDPTEFKNGYRRILDELPIPEADKQRIIEETMVAYEYNIELAYELGNKHLAPAGA